MNQFKQGLLATAYAVVYWLHLILNNDRSEAYKHHLFLSLNGEKTWFSRDEIKKLLGI